MKLSTITLIIGRMLVVAGTILIFLTFTQPWLSMRITTETSRFDEIRVSLSGIDLTSIAAGNVVLTNQMVESLDQLRDFLPSTSEFRKMESQLREAQRNGSEILMGVVLIWILPLVELIVSLILLVTNGMIRFRRGFGVLTLLIGIIMLVVFTAIWMRLDDALDGLRTNAGAREFFDMLDKADIQININVESGIISAIFLTILTIIGSIMEVMLPLPMWFTTKAQPVAAAPVATPAYHPIAQPAVSSIYQPIAQPIETSSIASNVCIACGKTLAAGTRFCGGCGARQ